MKGSPLENTKNALLTSLSQLNAQDTFNIIVFNRAASLFSSSMETATEEAILNAIKWVDTNFVANGDTNIMLPLTQVLFICWNFQCAVQNFVLLFHGLLIKTFLCKTLDWISVKYTNVISLGIYLVFYD